MTTRIEIPPLNPFQRWVVCGNGYPGASSGAVGTAGRVFLYQFDVNYTSVITGITFKNMATVAGNLRVGIYRCAAGITDTPAAGDLLVESASTAQVNANNTQTITLADTVLTPGSYYAAIEASDATATIGRYGATPTNECAFYYDRVGGYGALTNPCPAVTLISATLNFALMVRIG